MMHGQPSIKIVTDIICRGALDDWGCTQSESCKIKQKGASSAEYIIGHVQLLLQDMCSYTGPAERWEYEVNLLYDRVLCKTEKKEGNG